MLKLFLNVLFGTFTVHSETLDLWSSNTNYQNQAIQCDPNEDCILQCNVANGCDSSYIQCPQNHSCVIECSASESCQSAHIQCPINNTCNVTCNKKNSCRDSKINATYVSSFTLTESGQGFYVCTGIIIYFPQHDMNGVPRANIIGDDTHSAAGVATPLQFYAVNGWTDVYINSFLSYSIGTMYCLSDYSHSCSFAEDAFECNRTNDVCQDGQVYNRVIDVHVNGGVYSDNAFVSLAPHTIPGWSVDGPQSGLITPSGSLNVIGPFSGTGYVAIDYIVNITQTFMCSVPANVSISYRVFWCGDTEAEDYSKLYLNDIEQPHATVWGMPDTQFDGNVPLLEDDDLIRASGCDLYASDATDAWRYRDIEYTTNHIAGTYANPSFTVSFEFGLSYDQEWGGIADVRIRCTAIPTLAPSHNPTIEPTQQTIAPTDVPTLVPTSSPSSFPTVTPCQPDMNGFNAQWSASYRSILIDMRNDNTPSVVDINTWSFDCAALFDDMTYSLLSDSATCYWTRDMNDVIHLRLDLSSESTINVTSVMRINFNITYTCMPSMLHTYTHSVYHIASIEPPMYAAEPYIVVSLPTQIGTCDDLILDARSTTYLGGRDNALFEWTVTSSTNESTFYEGKYIEIMSDNLIKNTTYRIQIRVTNWYGAFATKSMNVMVSPNTIPIVSLHGISVYSATNLNLHGMIDIDADIASEHDCVGSTDGDSLHYELTWSVQPLKINTNDPNEINNELLSDLQHWIVSMSSPTLSVDVNKYLQNGLIYTFSLQLECLPPHACDIQSAHDVTYHYNAIHCGIMSNDIVLTDLDPVATDGLQFELNGGILTYDTNNKLDSSHLNWYWQCVNGLNENESCAVLIHNNDVHASTIQIDISTIALDYAQSYSFRFVMEVYDTSNDYRDHCTDSIVVELHTKNISDSSSSEKQFIVVASAMNTEINVNDRMRLFGDILNYNLMELTDGVMQYEWIEVNGQLTAHELTLYTQTSHDSMNLILKEGVLIEGIEYAFQLIVSQYTNEDQMERIGYGVSSTISIHVLKPPQMFTDSFVIQPSCTNVTYSNISQLLRTSFSLSLIADSDDPPLLYQFGYNVLATNTYFTASLLYASSVSDVYLPPLDTLTVFGTVIDSKSSVVSATLPCSIRLLSYSECVDFKTYVSSHSETLATPTQQYKYIYQQTNTYVTYLMRYDGDETCIKRALDDILDVLSSIHLSCETHYAISLAQTMLSVMDLVSSQDALVTIFYANSFNTLTQLLYDVLDPCNYIQHHTDAVEQWTISPHSIVTKIPLILDHNGYDITSDLSPIISNPSYHHLLYSIASSIIDMLSYSRDIDLANVLSASLYISELIRMSLSIPGEESFTQFEGVSIYSMRVNHEDIAVSVQNISVFIPRDITNPRGDDLFDSVDVLVVGIQTGSPDNVTTVVRQPKTNCKHVEGTLSDHSLSISILGNATNTSHLASNISFVFECDATTCGEGMDDPFNCVWYNERDDLWSNDGCSTLLSANQIQCSCSHLTTFATIHNIHSSDCTATWMQSKEWQYINWGAAGLFGLIFVYSVAELWRYYGCSKESRRYFKWKQKNVFAMACVAVTALLFCVSCLLESYVMHNETYLNEMDSHLLFKLYVLFLLLPQLSYLMLFSIIFYTWFVLAHGFIKNIHDVKKRMRVSLLIINGFVCCALCSYYILVLTLKDEHDLIFLMGAYIWSGLLTMIAIIVVIYSFLVGKTLYMTANISSQQNFAKKDWIVVRRLLIINTYLTLYRVYDSFTTIYLAINEENQTLIFSTIYIGVNVLNLCFICWMYRSSMRRIRWGMRSRQEDDTQKDGSDTRRGGLWSRFFEGSALIRKVSLKRLRSSGTSVVSGYQGTTPSQPWTPTAPNDIDSKTNDDDFSFPETGTTFTRLKSKSTRSTITTATPLSCITEEEEEKPASELSSVQNQTTPQADAKLTFGCIDEIDIIYDDDEFNNILDKRHSNTLTQKARITELQMADVDSVTVNSLNPFGAELDIAMPQSLSIDIPNAEQRKSVSKHQPPYDQIESESNIQLTPNTANEVQLADLLTKEVIDMIDDDDDSGELIMIEVAPIQNVSNWQKLRSETNRSGSSSSHSHATSNSNAASNNEDEAEVIEMDENDDDDDDSTDEQELLQFDIGDDDDDELNVSLDLNKMTINKLGRLNDSTKL